LTSCNEHGVYEADETLALPRPVKGWRGGPIAEIRLANLGTHWIWATGFQMLTGNCWGSSSPLMDLEPTPFSTCRAPTRQAAIELASAQLRKSLSPCAAEYREARAVLEWLDTLIPDQLDLFGAAA
jgi:hypothetical protein